MYVDMYVFTEASYGYTHMISYMHTYIHTYMFIHKHTCMDGGRDGRYVGI